MKAITLSPVTVLTSVILFVLCILSEKFPTKCLLGGAAFVYGAIGCWILYSEYKSLVTKND
jgi:hypothetical protein